MNTLINNFKSTGSNFISAANEFIQNFPKSNALTRRRHHLFKKSSSIRSPWKSEYYSTITSLTKKNGFSQNGSITSTRVLNNAITMQAVSDGNKLKID